MSNRYSQARSWGEPSRDGKPLPRPEGQPPRNLSPDPAPRRRASRSNRHNRPSSELQSGDDNAPGQRNRNPV
ncbi:MAG: hypothetical protein AMJ41_00765 [candidate division Zixibacteria bacterium DG_27]|nr:MAG: hypothetical protein AMJ41_00765 [candidate division Zixibacteria bacterium DG_27]